MPDILGRLFGGLLTAFGALSWISALYTLWTVLDAEAEKSAAMAAGPPPIVALDQFRPVHHVGPAGEVSLRLQIDPTERIELPSNTTAWIAPLFPPSAAPGAQPTAWAVHDDSPWSDGWLADATLGAGAIGPEIVLNGQRVDPRYHYKALARIGRDEGPLLVFQPFAPSRDIILAPDSASAWRQTALLLASLAIFFYGLWMVRRPAST